MLTLAIELSTETGSLALLDGERVVLDRRWHETEQRRQPFFSVLQAAAAAREIELARVELFVVGLGPGSFAGLRAGVAAAQALALPGGRAVCGVSSSAALALELREAGGTESVVVVGDARRERLWVACFGCEGPWPELESPLELVDHESPGLRLGEARATWVSPDWERIGTKVRALCRPADTLIESRRVPQARWVGVVGQRRFAAGAATEPVAPIYVHPPVSVAPRY
jgi:tRNA threonylcarbamoyl adenosine modification protein YeaZ